MRLDERKFLILKEIVDDYITTAIPVGSRTISRKAGMGLSSATIRNEMSDLEELGFLEQPHTSAGRVPSIKAYRWYVDQLLGQQLLSAQEARAIRSHFNRRSRQVEQVIRHAANVLSDVTRYTSIVVGPGIQHMRVRRVQLVPVSEGLALMVVVTDAGIVKDAMVRVPPELDADALYTISQMLTDQLSGCALSDMHAPLENMSRRLGRHKKLFDEMMDALGAQLSGGAADVVVGGSANLLRYPEYSDVDKARMFLSVLESKEKLMPLLRGAGQMELSIRIGPENDIPEMQDCSLLTATYRVGDGTQGMVGVVGPTRMNYSRALAVLALIGRSLSDVLSAGSGDDDEEG